jgi:hypothetical protein
VNTFVQQHYAAIAETQAPIPALLDAITHEHLDFSPGGDNPTLRAVFHDLATTQVAYTRSFCEFVMDFATANDSPLDTGSIDSIRAGFEQLNADLKDAAGSVSDEDFANLLIDRGGGFLLPPSMQIHIYREAILIVCGKISVYLRCLGVQFPDQWVHWIG